MLFPCTPESARPISFIILAQKMRVISRVLRESCQKSAELLQDLVHESGPPARRLARFAETYLAHIFRARIGTMPPAVYLLLEEGLLRWKTKPKRIRFGLKWQEK